MYNDKKIKEIKEKRFIQETNILSCIIQEPKYFDLIKESFFINKKNINIFKAINSLQLGGLPINANTVGNVLYDKTGKDSWLEEIKKISSQATSEDFKLYLKLLKKYNSLEEAIEISNGMINSIEEDKPEAINSGINLLSKISLNEIKHNFSLSDALNSTINDIVEARESGVPLCEPFNFSPFDEAMGGYFPEDLVIIAARPSVGKTTFSIFLSNMLKAPSAIVSSEMSKEGLSNKYLAARTLIPADYFRRVELLSNSDVEKIKKEANFLKDKKFWINDKPDITISEVESQVKEWVEKYNTKVVFVDYLQRINHDNKNLNRNLQIADIAKRLKNLGKKYKITVVALAQLNRNLELHNRKPVMADLKESGDIEQEADIIVFLHRDSYQKIASNEDSLTTAIIAKCRQGRIGDVPMIFKSSIQSFAPVPKETLEKFKPVDENRKW